MVDWVEHYVNLTEIPLSRIIRWFGIGRDKFYEWRRRHGEKNKHNGLIPRNFWLEEWEKQKIISFYLGHPEDGYRRITFMMLDANVVAVSPASTYRVLKNAGHMRRWNGKKSKKGTGFNQPSAPHKHWHIDVSYLNISGTFYYFCGILDGYSRYIVHWEIREAMTTGDIEIIIQRGREKSQGETPRIISDNGPQFIAKDFKEFVRVCGMSHVRTSPYYPQSNGKIERFHGSLKRECIRPKTPLSLEDARQNVKQYIQDYNTKRLHSAIGYITPIDKLEGRDEEIKAGRDQKLSRATELRKRRYKNIQLQCEIILDENKSLSHDITVE